MANQDVALRVTHVNKTFKLPHEKQSSLKGVVLSSLKGMNYEVQQAVKDASFEVKKGEFFGIVGRNGSGKSTLLKCITGVYAPNEGSIEINGKLVPFIELGVGLNPDLSGRDNVYLNGALFGFSRKQMDALYDDIVAFSELEKFMDQKLKNYSSGMQVRLAFSIAIRAKGDVLLLDEVLAVGDAAFQQKCFDYFASLKRDKKTIIFVSHSMPMVERFCDRALLLEYGEIKAIGTSSEIAGLYEDMILQEEAQKQTEAAGTEATVDPQIEARIAVKQDGKTVRAAEAFKDMQIVVKLKAQQDMEGLWMGLNIQNSEGQVVFAVDTIDHIGELSLKKDKELSVLIDVDNIFNNGTYSFGLNISDGKDASLKRVLRKRKVAPFTVYGVRKNLDSLVHPRCTVKSI